MSLIDPYTGAQLSSHEKVIENPPENVININGRKRFKGNFVEDFEEEEATRLVEEHLGFSLPRVFGYHMLVRIYLREEDTENWVDPVTGKESVILRPSVADSMDRYQSMTALVLAKGPDCYKDPSFNGLVWCRVGDWITIPLNEGSPMVYRDVNMRYIRDNKAFGGVEDPSFVTRI